MSDPFAPGLLSRLPEPPRKVAVLRASRIGDFVCATPAFRALRAALPDAEITLITLPMLHALAARLLSVDRVAAFPGFPGLAEQLFDARRTARFLRRMQAKRFDLAVQMQGTGLYSNVFTLMLGARTTAGFVRPGDPPGRLDAALPFPERGHEAERVLALTTFLGAPTLASAPEFPLRTMDHAAAEGLLLGAEPPLIGVHPTARDSTRRWGLERFAAAAMELRHRHGGTIVVLGEADDRATVDAAFRRNGPPFMNLMGRTSLATLGAVIARLALLVTNDTGPAHIAYALGTPTVTVFGGGDAERYAPPLGGPHRVLLHEVPCRPCGYAVCPIHNLCLERVTVEQVLGAAEGWMRVREAGALGLDESERTHAAHPPPAIPGSKSARASSRASASLREL